MLDGEEDQSLICANLWTAGLACELDRSIAVLFEASLRKRAGERTTMLSAASPFADAAEIYLIKIADRREASTYDLY